MNVSSTSLTFLCLVTTALAQINTYIAGYEPLSNVKNLTKIDLDQKCIVDALVTFDFSAALNCYAVGGNCVKNDGTILTIQSLSQESVGNSKQQEEKYFKIENDYWISKGLPANEYANTMILAASNGQSVNDDFTFSDKSDRFRAEAVKKGTVHLAIAPYVVYLMDESYNNCLAGNLDPDMGAGYALDEAIALYTGSSEGVYAGGINGLETTTHFYMQYAMAEKQAIYFGTAGGDGILNPSDVCCYSQNNADIFKLFVDVKSEILLGNCDEAYKFKDAFYSYTLVPFIQGTLKYLYYTDPKVFPFGGGFLDDKELGELWAYATALLPILFYHDPGLGDALYDKVWKNENNYNFAEFKEALEMKYVTLGVTIEQVGGICDPAAADAATTCTYYVDGEFSYDTSPGYDATSSSNNGDNGTPAWAIAFTTILVILVVCGCAFAAYVGFEKGKQHQALSDEEDVGPSQIQLNDV